jgi:RNA polymerase sigma-32 factor
MTPAFSAPARLARKARIMSVAPSDTLAAYLRSIKRYPLLSREEERELTTRYAETRDQKIADRLVNANLRLVVTIVGERNRNREDILDLIQEGNLGLYHAVRKFDPTVGAKLSVYAVPWIRAYVMRYSMENHRLIRIGTTKWQRDVFFNAKKVRAKTDGDEAVAAELGVTVEQLQDAEQRLGASEVSMSTRVLGEEEDERTLGDRLADADGRRPDRLAERRERDRIVRQVVAELFGASSPRDREVIRKRLLSEDPPTLQEIGDGWGTSRERVRQVEARLVKRLRAHLKAALGDAVSEAA